MAQIDEGAKTSRTLDELKLAVQALQGSQKRKASANPFDPTNSRTQVFTPTVTGVGVSESMGSVVVTWSPVRAAAVKRYEVHIARDATFTADAELVASTQTRLVISDRTPDLTYYVRVRAVDPNGNAGGWSTVFSVYLRQLENGDIAAEAIRAVNVQPETAVAYVEDAIYDGWTYLDTGSAGGAAEDSFPGVDVIFDDEDTKAVLEMDIQYEIASKYGDLNDENWLEVALIRNPVGRDPAMANPASWTTVDTIVIDFKSNIGNPVDPVGATTPSTSRMTLHLRFEADFLPPEGEGTYTYGARFKIYSNNNGVSDRTRLALLPKRIFMSAFIHRR